MKVIQNVLAVSALVKQFIADTAASFSAPNKGGEVTAATQREVVDALVAFAEATRYITRPMVQPVLVEAMDDEGNVALVEAMNEAGEPLVETVQVEVDSLGEFIEAELAKRSTATRANSGGAKIASLEAQLKAALAQLEKMTG